MYNNVDTPTSPRTHSNILTHKSYSDFIVAGIIFLSATTEHNTVRIPWNIHNTPDRIETIDIIEYLGYCWPYSELQYGSEYAVHSESIETGIPRKTRGFSCLR